MTQPALTIDVKARRNMGAKEYLESISITIRNGWMSEWYWQSLQEKETEGVDGRLKLLMSFESDHGRAFIHEQQTHSDYCEHEWE
jgi:hypothetical protein